MGVPTTLPKDMCQTGIRASFSADKYEGSRELEAIEATLLMFMEEEKMIPSQT
jgi:hypothetical protein